MSGREHGWKQTTAQTQRGTAIPWRGCGGARLRTGRLANKSTLQPDRSPAFREPCACNPEGQHSCRPVTLRPHRGDRNVAFPATPTMWVGSGSARVSRAGEASRRAPFKLVAAEVTRLQIPGAAAGSSVASRQSEPPDVGCYHLRRTAAAVRGSVLECGSPLPLFLPSVMKPRSTFRPWSNSSPSESARGLDALQALAECCCRFAMIEIGREGVSPSPYSGTAACGPSKPDL